MNRVHTHLRFVKVGIIVGLATGIVFASLTISTPVSAVATSCSASVSPSVMTASVQQNLTFVVTNTDSVTYNWIKVTRPSNSYTLWSTNVNGWGITATDATRTLRFGTLSPGNQLQFTISTEPAGTPESAKNWTVQVSDNDGVSSANCTGSLSTSISSTGPDTTPPTISNLTVSNVTNSSVTISWSTDEAADSQVLYGPTNQYGSHVNSSVDTTSHSLTITGLSANTTYHYKVKSLDDAGNIGETSDLTFVTSSQQSTITVVVTPTPTNTGTPTPMPSATGTPTPTPTPTPIPDTRPPVITLQSPVAPAFKEMPEITASAVDDRGVVSVEYSYGDGRWVHIPMGSSEGDGAVRVSFVPERTSEGQVQMIARARDAAGNTGQSEAVDFWIDQSGPDIRVSTDLSRYYDRAPQIQGTAQDRSGVRDVSYSVDGGSNWVPVDETTEHSSDVVSFSFIPPARQDGNYPIRVRAFDHLGNERRTESQELIIDRYPPRFGPAALFVGTRAVTSNPKNAVMGLVAGVEYTLALTVIGGATDVRVGLIDVNTKQPGMQLPLSYSTSTGLWHATIRPETPGLFYLHLTAIDGAQQKTETDIARVDVLQPGVVRDGSGEPVAGARVFVYALDRETDAFVRWNGAFVNTPNPQRTDDSGSYEMLLDRGTYYMEVRADGFTTIRTNIFTLDALTAIRTPFVMQPSRRLHIGPLWIPLWDISYVSQVIFPDSGIGGQSRVDQRINVTGDLGTILHSSVGTPFVAAVVPAWTPFTVDQIDVLEAVLAGDSRGATGVVVMPHISSAAVTLRAARGGYDTPFIADVDGTIIDGLGTTVAPTWYVFDRSGAIVSVHEGAMQEAELTALIEGL